MPAAKSFDRWHELYACLSLVAPGLTPWPYTKSKACGPAQYMLTTLSANATPL
jgi:hypothetical protein